MSSGRGHAGHLGLASWRSMATCVGSIGAWQEPEAISGDARAASGEANQAWPDRNAISGEPRAATDDSKRAWQDCVAVSREARGASGDAKRAWQDPRATSEGSIGTAFSAVIRSGESIRSSRCHVEPGLRAVLDLAASRPHHERVVLVRSICASSPVRASTRRRA